MKFPATLVFSCTIAFLFLLTPSFANVGPGEFSTNEIDEFDVVLANHSFPGAGVMTEAVFNPQWSLTRFIPDDDFILRGARVLIEEYTTEVNSMTIRVYADDGGSPGSQLLAYNGTVSREVVTATTVWLELELPGEDVLFFDANEEFWISVGTANVFAWNVCEDTDGSSGSNLVASSAGGGPFSLDSQGDWVIEAGGEYGAGIYDLVAYRTWNDQNRYHVTTENGIAFQGRILNAGTTSSPQGDCTIEVTNSGGSTVFTSTVDVPTLASGSSYTFTTPTEWNPTAVGDYTATMTVIGDGTDDPANNEFVLFQQVVDPRDWLSYDDGSYESSETIADGNGLSIMFKPPVEGAVASCANIYFLDDYDNVELKAYTYLNSNFSEFWSYSGPVMEGWNLFPIVSPALNVNHAVSVVIHGMNDFAIPVDTSDPVIVENAEMPPAFMLTDGNQWYLNFDIAGKPLVHVNFEYPDEAENMTVNLTTSATPVILAPGDEFTWNANIENTLNQSITVYAWTEMVWPDGTFFGPLQVFGPITLTPGNAYNLGNQVQAIPISYPDGTCVFRLKVGETPVELEAFDGTTVIVQATAGVSEEHPSELPTGFEVSQAMPNPFNPSTELMVSLPATGELTVTLYDVMGREIEQLAEGTYSAGHHRIQIDGNGLASGMYFAHVHMAGHAPVLRKLTLIK